MDRTRLVDSVLYKKNNKVSVVKHTANDRRMLTWIAFKIDIRIANGEVASPESRSGGSPRALALPKKAELQVYPSISTSATIY